MEITLWGLGFWGLRFRFSWRFNVPIGVILGVYWGYNIHGDNGKEKRNDYDELYRFRVDGLGFRV